MKIALLTIWRVKNYGAELQAYATIKALKQLGHDVQIIDYRLANAEPSTIKSFIINLITKFTKADRKFQKFWKKFFPKPEKYYRTMNSLQKNPPKADIYILGSDQVWNPEITQNKALIYFLNFGNNSIKRIAYAASFGTEKWNSNILPTNIVQPLLNRFSAISCRENTGVKILNNTFHLNAINVLDPTLLHSDYSEIIGKPKSLNTLVFYPLSPYPELEQMARRKASELGKDFVNINRRKILIKAIAWDRPSVEEWITNIAQASIVVTPSFHGLAFSLIYKKDFIIIQNKGGHSVKSRIMNLLEQLDLTDRYFETIEDAQNSNMWKSHIDYVKVDRKLAVLRENSWNFLRQMI